MAPSKPAKPPPETPDETWTRSWVIVSFWAVALLLGLPAWWQTTMIYRATLPMREMNEWADGKACRLVIPLQISIQASALPEVDAQHLVRLTQHALDDFDNFSTYHLRLGLASNETAPDDIALFVNLDPLEQTATSPQTTLQPHAPVLDILYPPTQIPALSSTSAPLAQYIAATLQDLFTEEQATLSYVISASGSNHGSALSGTPGSSPGNGHNHNGQQPHQPRSVSPELAADLAKRTTRSLKYAPTYHLTFSLFSPSSAPSSWDIDTAVEKHVQPLLQSLAPISNFTVDSQVQLYARFSESMAPPQYDESRKVWTLSEEALSGFINSAEWPLTPSIGSAPTVNFILYVPDKKQQPLVISENGGNSWLIPQWGGVYILNSSPDNLSEKDLESALLTFSQQLLSLLGIPKTPASLPLQMLSLARVRSASLLLSAASTLGSLSRLVVALPSISIPSSVAHSVDKTLYHLKGSCASLREGRFRAAMTDARAAELEAEKGFFEKSMVGQVYFPDEHKVAVYLPLLGPVGVPLIMAAVKELKRRRAARSGAAAPVQGTN